MSRKKTREEWIEDARKVHGDKYDYSKVEYVNSNTKVVIVCPEHGEFLKLAREHLRGTGCNECSKMTTEKFVDVAIEIHGDRYDYSLVKYTGANKKITIICHDHGPFEQRASAHTLQKHGCPKCGMAISIDSQRMGTDWFIQKSREKHGSKYNYSKTRYTNAFTHVTITCPIHGDFEQYPASHCNSGHGCKQCAFEAISNTSECFLKKARQVHDDKYDYSLVTEVHIRHTDRICVICKEHGRFTQKANTHLNGHGCPRCGKKSKGEESIREYIDERGIVHKEQHSFKSSIINRSKFDFAISDNVFVGLVEYNGKQHYTPISFGSKKKHAKQRNLLKSIERDHKKLQWCCKHTIPLLIIPYWDYDRIPEILDDVFAGRTPTFSEPPEIVKKHEAFRKRIRDHLGITEPEVLCGLIKPEAKEKAAWLQQQTKTTGSLTP